MSRNRSYCFTWNNYDDEAIKAVEDLMAEAKFGLYGKEIAPTTGTPHVQGYIHFANQRGFNAIRKRLYGAHIEIARGTPKQNEEYCGKDKNYRIFGEKPIGQGARVDISKVAGEIVDGLKVEKLIMEDPMFYHQYGRTLNKIEDLTMRKNTRKEMTKGIWYYGKTGTGKSHKAFENFRTETHYLVPNDNGWWDAYTQQETVIFNDFRGEITYNELLQLVDKWPHYVRRRGREPMSFTSKLVIITSSLHPSQLYCRRAEEDDIAQLYRRFEIICLDSEVVEGNNRASTELTSFEDTKNWLKGD